MSEKSSPNPDKLSRDQFFSKTIDSLRSLPGSIETYTAFEEVLAEAQGVAAEVNEAAFLLKRSEAATRTMIRILEVIGSELYRKKEITPEEAAKILHQEKENLKLHYEAARKNISRRFEKISASAEKQIDGLMKELQSVCGDEPVHIKEWSLVRSHHYNLEREKKNKARDQKKTEKKSILPEPNFESLVSEEEGGQGTFGQYLEDLGSKVRDAASLAIFLEMLPVEMKEELKDYLNFEHIQEQKNPNDKSRTHYLLLAQKSERTTINLPLVNQVLCSQILFLMDINTGCNIIGPSVFPSNEEIKKYKDYLHAFTIDLAESNLRETIETSLLAYIFSNFGDELQKKYPSETLREHFINWLKNRIEECYDSVLKFLNNEYDQKASPFETKEGVNRLSEVNVFRLANHENVSSQFEEKRIFKFEDHAPDEQEEFIRKMANNGERDLKQKIEKLTIANISRVIENAENIFDDEAFSMFLVQIFTNLENTGHRILPGDSGYSQKTSGTKFTRLDMLIFYWGGEVVDSKLEFNPTYAPHKVSPEFIQKIKPSLPNRSIIGSQFWASYVSNPEVLFDLMLNREDGLEESTSIDAENTIARINEVEGIYGDYRQISKGIRTVFENWRDLACLQGSDISLSEIHSECVRTKSHKYFVEFLVFLYFNSHALEESHPNLIDYEDLNTFCLDSLSRFGILSDFLSHTTRTKSALTLIPQKIEGDKQEIIRGGDLSKINVPFLKRLAMLAMVSTPEMRSLNYNRTLSSFFTVANSMPMTDFDMLFFEYNDGDILDRTADYILQIMANSKERVTEKSFLELFESLYILLKKMAEIIEDGGDGGKVDMPSWRKVQGKLRKKVKEYRQEY